MARVRGAFQPAVWLSWLDSPARGGSGSGFQRILRGEEILAAATGSGVLVLSYIACLAWLQSIPLSRMLEFVPDDTFYYLKIAQNLYERGHVSFNGADPTTGYHPLWLYTVYLIVAICRPSGPESLLCVVLALGGACHVACAMVLYRSCVTWGGWRIAALLALTWLVAPLALLLSVSGLETGLYFLLLTAFFAWMTRHREDFSQSNLSWSIAGRYVLLCALISLARSDFVLVAVALSAMLAVDRLLSRSMRGLTDGRLALIAIGGPAAALGVVWFYSYLITGSPIQDSGAMKMLWRHYQQDPAAHLPHHSGPAAWLQAVVHYWLRNWLGRGSFDPLMKDPISGWISLSLVLSGCAAVGALVLKFRRARGLGDVALWLPLLLLLIVPLFYAHVLADIQLWHLALCLAALFWALIALSRHVIDKGHIARAAVWYTWSILLALGLWGTWSHILRLTPELYPWQPAYLESALLEDEALPKGTLVGCFNAGISGYFTRNIQIVDIDGLVSHQAVLAYQQGRFGEYLRTAGIQYIFDEDRTIARGLYFAKGAVPELKPVARYGLPAWNGDRVLYRIEGFSGGPSGDRLHPPGD